MTEERRTYGDRRNGEYERLRRLEIAVAVLESTTHEIKEDVRSAKNYALVTLGGGFGCVCWQLITRTLGH